MKIPTVIITVFVIFYGVSWGLQGDHKHGLIMLMLALILINTERKGTTATVTIEDFAEQIAKKIVHRLRGE